jgi:hypothetical protein
MRRNQLHQVSLAKVDVGVERRRDGDRVGGGHGGECTGEETTGWVHTRVEGGKGKLPREEKGEKRSDRITSIKRACPGTPSAPLCLVGCPVLL